MSLNGCWESKGKLSARRQESSIPERAQGLMSLTNRRFLTMEVVI